MRCPSVMDLKPVHSRIDAAFLLYLPRRPHDLLKVLNPKPEPFHIEIEARPPKGHVRYVVLPSLCLSLLQRHRNSLYFWQLPRLFNRPSGSRVSTCFNICGGLKAVAGSHHSA